MPSYGWLFKNTIDTAKTPAMIRAMQQLGVPYEAGYDQKANSELVNQAATISASLQLDKIKVNNQKEIIALIAYLQRLGKDIKATPKQETAQQ
jgi:cytochrome c oxidase cbb3-type subunit I/II